jgi:molybdopterin/thiamine biosynthesis adenylyltransferase
VTKSAIPGNPPQGHGASYRPLLFRPKHAVEREALQALRAGRPAPFVVDTLETQLKGLIESRHPRGKLCPDELAARAAALSGPDPHDFGVWVYFPWRHTLVHLLDEREFVELRTARNRYKITADEQARLSERRCGIVGLSVGSAIALTIATERLCGELRLADHDRLELGNLNRLQGSVLSLGMPKVVLAARAIAELDPFLRVTCFEAGITRENIDEFLTVGGKLDLLIEECDDLAIKLLCRERARRAGIAVVMEANDRCTLDVERYDLEPERPLLHGLLSGVDLSRVAELETNEEKVPILMPMVGTATMSPKLAASLIEVGESLEGWPQLGSDVALGAAVVAHVARRIALGEHRGSGRYFVDLEALIADDTPRHAPEAPAETPSAASGVQHVGRARAGRAEPHELALPSRVVEELVAAAVLAPSGGNQQPWIFEHDHRVLRLLLDRRRTGGLLDYRDAASLLGLGAAAENLTLEAQRRDLGVALAEFPEPDAPEVVAEFRFFEPHARRSLESRAFVGLAAQIGSRHTNRRLCTPAPLPSEALERLEAVVRASNRGRLRWITERSDMIRLGEIAARAERLRMLHERGHRDFTRELKLTPDQARRDGDGIDPTTLDLTPAEHAGLALLRSPLVAAHLRAWHGGRALERLTRKSFERASAVGVLSAPACDGPACFGAGRVVERLWLAAEAGGLALQPHTAAIFLFLRLIEGDAGAFDACERAELHELHGEFQRLTGVEDRALFLFRLFPGCEAPGRSLRRELKHVLVTVE